MDITTSEREIKDRTVFHLGGFDWFSPKNLITLGIGDIEYNPKEPMEGFINDKYKIVDCRHLKDESGNSLDDYRNLIRKTVEYLDEFNDVACCCMAGFSRSNAIAVGVIMNYIAMPYHIAYDKVKDKLGSKCLVEQAHLNALKKLEKELHTTKFQGKKQQ